MRIIEIGGAVLLMLPVAHAAAPSTLKFLPLGGSAIAEIGIVLGFCVALKLLRDALKEKRNDKNKNNSNS